MEIYKITNKITNDFYIGSAINFKNRKWGHISSLRKNKHKNQFIQNSWNKYGEEAFIFDIVEVVDKKENLIIQEQYWMDKLSPTFNLAKVAGSPLGVKHTKKSRMNMSLAHIGLTEEERGHKENCECSVCKHRTGENHWNYGKNVPLQTKNKISETLKIYYGNGGINPNQGKSPSTEIRKQIAEKLSIPIIQYDLNNNFIEEWESTKIAGTTLNIHASNINACLKNKTKTSGKFIWKYKFKT